MSDFVGIVKEDLVGELHSGVLSRFLPACIDFSEVCFGSESASGQQALSERANTHFERFGGVPLGRFLLSKTSNHG